MNLCIDGLLTLRRAGRDALAQGCKVGRGRIREPRFPAPEQRLGKAALKHLFPHRAPRFAPLVSTPERLAKLFRRVDRTGNAGGRR
jgi:hypothetical protein